MHAAVRCVKDSGGNGVTPVSLSDSVAVLGSPHDALNAFIQENTGTVGIWTFKRPRNGDIFDGVREALAKRDPLMVYDVTDNGISRLGDAMCRNLSRK